MIGHSWRQKVYLMGLLAGLSNLATGMLVAGSKKPLRVGFHLDPARFDKAFSESDVTLATQVLFQKILGESGEFEPTFHPFRSESEYVEAIKAGELDYVEMGPLLWLRMAEEERDSLIPLSVIQMGEARLERFLLLSRPGTTLQSLAGKRLKINSGLDRGIGKIWMNHELRVEGRQSLDTHFGDVDFQTKANEVLLPTFFGKADACIVREEDYNVAKELNPQIGARLVPVKISPAFPLMITVAAGSNRKFVSERLGGAPSSILNQSGAQQAFALLKVKGVNEYKDGDLDALAKILTATEEDIKVTSVKPAEDDGE